MQAEQNKDPTERQMTKIAREAAKFTVQMMKADGIGTAEFDFIHLVRHNPGMTQADVRAALKIDKGAAARRAASLEAKGYLVRKPNPDDGRSQLLYATPKAEELKNSKAAIETVFYAWLVEELPEAERDAFCKTLETLYWRSKNQRRAGFPDVTARVQQMNGEELQDEEHGKRPGAPAGPGAELLRKPVLAVVTVSGLIYNLGLVVGPWFEGQLAQCLLGILNGNETFAAMAALCAGYLIAIAVVQGSRFIKRLYVRKFANNINRSMKQVLYANLVRKDKVELEQAGTGTLMTKAISDVDACAEGMRKFTTEIFDTGIALLAYAVMLLGYDWRLALLCLVFAPISYYIAEQMKNLVQRTGAANKESTGRLSAATLDRVSGALTYRVYGCEPQRDAAYEACLQDYERTAVKAGLPVAAMPPLYGVISMTGVLFIFTFGARNVAGTGWAAWDIAAFTTFLSCFGKLAVKSSHAAKLFNAVQKAQVSWGRIKPLMRQPDPLPEEIPAKPETLTVNKLGFAYRGGAPVLQDITFTAQPGRIFGITGAVACGKSTLGKAFLCELPYTGSIQYGGREMAGMTDAERCGVVGYLGHDPELLSDSIRNNILLGRDDDAWKYLRAVCLEDEVKAMPNGLDTRVGDGGVRLSGGQQQRLALARTLAHPRPLLVLDDPFSALDRKTEEQVFANLRKMTAGSTVLLISHRLYLFPQMNGVLWIQDGKAVCAAHKELMAQNPQYAALVNAQEGGEQDEPEK